MNSIVNDLSGWPTGIEGSTIGSAGVDVARSGRNGRWPGVPHPSPVMQAITSRPSAARRAIIGRTSWESARDDHGRAEDTPSF